MTAVGKSKKKADYVRRVERSRDLLMFWYFNRCTDSTQRYHPDGSELTIAAAPVEYERQGITTTTGKLTADGRETRTVDASLSGSFPAGWATDPMAQYSPHSHNDKRREQHAKKCLMHVEKVNPDLHRALEMHAAGWKLDDIAAELQKSVHKARSHVERGLDVISSYQILVKP